jgi:hypothetical protein
MRFKSLKSFDNALDYVNRVGIISVDRNSPGWIPYWQGQACNLIEKIEKLYNVKVPLKDYPYYDTPLLVHYIRPTELDYNGYVIVKLPDNSEVRIKV